jgi:hypothetical protein
MEPPSTRGDVVMADVTACDVSFLFPSVPSMTKMLGHVCSLLDTLALRP